MTLDQELIQVAWASSPTATPPTLGVGDYNAEINSFQADGWTAIGTALKTAREQFETAGTAAGQTVILLSDGENNSGEEDPRQEAEALQELGVTVFTVPVGAAADRILFSEIGRGSGASSRGSLMLDAPLGDELPTIFTEMFARSRSEALTTARTPSAVAGTAACGGGEFPCEIGLQSVNTQWGCLCLPSGVNEPALPPWEEFTIPVTSGSQRLNVMVSSRNAVVDPWGPELTLTSPGNIEYTEGSGEVTWDPLYRLFSILAPEGGDWTLRIRAATAVPQRSYFVSHVEDPGPDCSARALTVHAVDGETVEIKAEAYWNSIRLDRGIAFGGLVRRPDGTTYPLTFSRRPGVPPEDIAVFNGNVGRGIYDVVVTCDVQDGADAVIGPSIYGPRPNEPEGMAPPPAPEVDVPAFHREAQTSFYIESSVYPVRPGGDCDGDGIPDEAELPGDLDGDGAPNICDDDADGDDLPDSKDPNPLVPDGLLPLAACASFAGCSAVGSVTVFGDSHLHFSDRVWVVAGDVFGTVVSGAPGIYAGVATELGDVWTKGDLELRNDAHLNGLGVYGGTLHQEPGSGADDGIRFGEFALPVLAEYQVDFPAPTGGDVHVEVGQALALAPGSYGVVNIKPGATLALSAGTYYFGAFQVLEPESEVLLDTSSGPIYILVQDTFIYRGALTDVTGRQDRVFVGYFGSAPAFVERALTATLVAPLSTVTLASAEHFGAFFARELVSYPDATISQVPFAFGWPAATAAGAACADGVLSAGETDVDCGGVVCPACDLGRSCAMNQDCLSGNCATGVCQLETMGTVTATLVVTSDWGAGYCADVAVRNTGSAPTSSWSVLLDPHDSTIDNMWNAERIAQGAMVEAQSLSYNAAVYPDAVTSFGFCATKTGPGYSPEVLQAASE